ncbi:MAG: HEPN domain-containing protein [Bacteroides sp.]|nr:HEPN domain-containing protein [Bacteroides sp.]
MTDEEREEIVRLRLENSAKAAEVLKERELWSSVVNRMYCAFYYAVVALLIQNGIETNTQAGMRQMLNFHFVKAGKLFKEMGQ